MPARRRVVILMSACWCVLAVAVSAHASGLPPGAQIHVARVFDDVILRPRSAVATASVDLRTTVLGQTIELPFLLAPVGSSRLFYPRGEEAAA